MARLWVDISRCVCPQARAELALQGEIVRQDSVLLASAEARRAKWLQEAAAEIPEPQRKRGRRKESESKSGPGGPRSVKDLTYEERLDITRMSMEDIKKLLRVRRRRARLH